MIRTVFVALLMCSALSIGGYSLVSRIFHSQRHHQIEQLCLDFDRQLQLEDGYSKCRAIADELTEIGTRTKDDSLQSRGLSRRAYIELYFGKWGEHWQSDLALAEKLCGESESLARAELLTFRGFIKGNWEHDFEQGITDIHESLRIGRQMNADSQLVLAHGFLSQLLVYINQQDRSQEAALMAYEIAKHSGHGHLIESALDYLLVSYSTPELSKHAVPYAKEMLETQPENLLAHKLLFQAGEKNRLIPLLEDRIQAFETNKNRTAMQTYRLANLYSRMAYVKQRQGNSEQGFKYIELSKALYQASSSKLDSIAMTFYRAYHHAQNGDVQLANQAFAGLLAESNGKIPKSFNQLLLAEYYQKTGQPQKSIAALHVHFGNTDEAIAKRIKNQEHNVVNNWQQQLLDRSFRQRVDQQNQSASRRQLIFVLLFSLVGAISAVSATRYRALQVNNQELEALVNQRTQSLIQAVEEAELASKSKSEFLARANHEIRNPIHLISGYADLLREMENLQELERREYVEAIGNSCEHLSQLLANVMQICEIGEGIRPLSQNLFSVPDLGISIQSMYSESANSKGLNFQVLSHDAPACSFVGDDVLYRQVLMNLTSNAIKYTDAGNVDVDIYVDDADNECPNLYCVVRDTGPGIAKQFHDRVFQPFAKLPFSERGKGLGLHITKSLVDLAGGRIWFESDSGLGSEFHVKFPITLATEYQLAVNESSREDYKQFKILVVDDKANVRRLVVRQLEQLGHLAFSAETLDETLDQILHQNPDFVFVDLRMPGNDGIDVLNSILQLQTNVLTVAMTGDVTAETRAKSQEVGFDAFLEKPFQQKRLRQVLGELFRKRATINRKKIETL